MRAYYERIEPIAESLGDLDPKIDFREVDAVADGLDWTGFHRIEKDLWVPAEDALNADGETPAWQDWAPSTPEERAAFGDQLIADVQELYDYVHSADFQTALESQGVAGLSNGAIALLDEVATGKISGEEDWWSGTDLWDFAANVEGSKMAFSLVRDFARVEGRRRRSPRRADRRRLRRPRGRARRTRLAGGRLRQLQRADGCRQARADGSHQRARRAAVAAHGDRSGLM